MLKYNGPLPTLKQVGKVACGVELSSWCKIYNVLHVSVPKPYFTNNEDASRNKLKHPIFELTKVRK